MATWNRNVSMRALRAFCVAAERDSFRLAAEDLYLTASAVSHQIKQLELALGIQLFVREPRALRLTEAGRALASDLQPILEDLDIVIERNSQRAGHIELKLSVQPFFANELLVPRLSRFIGENPDISLSVDTTDTDQGKLDRSADVSIRLLSSPPARISSHKLFSLRLLPVGTLAFYDSIKVVGGRITSDFPLIVHDARPKSWQKWQADSGIQLPRHAPSIRLDSMVAVAQAAEQGLGAALIPAQLCKSRIDAGLLTPLFDHELALKEAYYFVCDETDSTATHVCTFRDWVLQEFASD
jgi:LysR family glycine cleavage system transcriptional activator